MYNSVVISMIRKFELNVQKLAFQFSLEFGLNVKFFEGVHCMHCIQ